MQSAAKQIALIVVASILAQVTMALLIKNNRTLRQLLD